jgi:ABC-2 type transport system ATP-binding protein
VRLCEPEGHRLIARLIESFPGRIRSVTLAQPSLEDVFIARTGHRFRPAEDRPPEAEETRPEQREEAPVG